MIPSISQPESSTEARELRAMLAHRERQIAAVRRINEALLSRLKVDEMVRETLEVALDVLAGEVGSVQLYNPANDTLVFRYVLDPRAPELVDYAVPASQGIGGRVFRTGIADLTDEVAAHPEFNTSVDAKTSYQTKSMLTVPLKRPTGEPLGVMQILNLHEPFNGRDLEVLEVLAAQAAQAIEYAGLAQQAKQAALINVIGDISHDINNMLTPIQSGIWMLQPQFDELFATMRRMCAECPPEQRWGGELQHAMADVSNEYGWILENALDSAARVQERTREIAAALKGELSPPEFEQADLNDVARDVVRSLRPAAEASHVEVRLDLAANLPRAEFDRKQLYNALYNLVNNAIPETPAGGSITVRTGAPQDGETTLLLEVQDTGRGMPENVRSKLFTDAAVSTKQGGTGLGTRIVAGVVQRHHGTLEVQSEVGRGTTFSLRLPLSQIKH